MNALQTEVIIYEHEGCGKNPGLLYFGSYHVDNVDPCVDVNGSYWNVECGDMGSYYRVSLTDTYHIERVVSVWLDYNCDPYSDNVVIYEVTTTKYLSDNVEVTATHKVVDEE